MTVQFSDAAVPSSVRVVPPNPFTAVVQTLVAGMVEDRSTTAKTFSVPLADVAKTRRQLTAAGNLATPPVTVRSTVDENADQSVAIVTFWTVTKITRKGSSDS